MTVFTTAQHENSDFEVLMHVQVNEIVYLFKLQ